MNICRKGTPTEADRRELARFREFLKIHHEAEEEFALPRKDALRYAAIEVYGNENAE